MILPGRYREGKTGSDQNARGSLEAQIGSKEALQSLDEGLPNPIYPSLGKYTMVLC